MNNPRLAIRYAKSLVDLAREQNILEDVNKDIRFLESIGKSNPDFVSVLRSPVIPSDKKSNVLKAITDGRISALTSTFIGFLISKGRELNLMEIVNAFIEQYNVIKNIHRVKITTATEMTQDFQDSLVKQVATEEGFTNIEVEAKVDESLIGGFIMETGGKLIDASIRRDLQDVKKQFLNNDYIHKLR